MTSFWFLLSVLFFSAILCGFVRTIADTALAQSFFGGKDGRVMAPPGGLPLTFRFSPATIKIDFIVTG